ncbi:MAG: hypothetical protein ACQKBT_12155, partial [Puniceicoccales bacterium]
MSYPYVPLRSVFAWIVALSTCSTGALSAQSPHEEEPSTFRILSAVGGFRDLFYEVEEGKNPIKLNIRTKFSREYPSPENKELVLFRQIPPPAGSPPGTPPT